MTDFLRLPDYRVESITETEHDYHVKATISGIGNRCPQCQSVLNVIGHGRNEILVHDLPSHGKRVGIYIDAPRFRCKSCGKAFMGELPGVNPARRMTDRLVRWIGKQSLKNTFARVADEIGLDEKTVRNVFRDHIAELEKRYKFETPDVLGIDEIHLIKPRCVLTNISKGTVVDVLKDRNKDTVTAYLAGLKEKKNIRTVTIDMWRPYKDAVEVVLPHCGIVIDKFHVVKMANESLDRVRKSLKDTLTPAQLRTLKSDRYVLLKRERDLTDKDWLLLDGWTKNYPPLAEAYRAKETFYGIYEATNRRKAEIKYREWRITLPAAQHEPYKPLLTAMDNWSPYIFNYFDHRVTNALTESLNAGIREFDRAGRGYSFEALRAKVLFTRGIHKTERVRPKFERQPMEVRENSWGFYAPGEMGHGLPPGAIGKATMSRYKPEQDEGHELNYGADINTLLRYLREGKL